MVAGRPIRPRSSCPTASAIGPGPAPRGLRSSRLGTPGTLAGARARRAAVQRGSLGARRSPAARRHRTAPPLHPARPAGAGGRPTGAERSMSRVAGWEPDRAAALAWPALGFAGMEQGCRGGFRPLRAAQGTSATRCTWCSPIRTTVACSSIGRRWRARRSPCSAPIADATPATRISSASSPASAPQSGVRDTCWARGVRCSRCRVESIVLPAAGPDAFRIRASAWAARRHEADVFTPPRRAKVPNCRP